MYFPESMMLMSYIRLLSIRCSLNIINMMYLDEIVIKSYFTDVI